MQRYVNSYIGFAKVRFHEKYGCSVEALVGAVFRDSGEGLMFLGWR